MRRARTILESTCLQLAAIMRCAALLAAIAMGGLAMPEALAQGRGPRGDADFAADQATFQFLLEHRDAIQRQVTRVPAGVETLTESNDPAVAARLAEHVEAMHKRLLAGRGIHMRDPLFREIFRHADAIALKVEKTPRGVRVSETSADPYVVRLIQAHADVVSQFLKHGPSEVRSNHALPARP